ncbi:acyl-CoA dehydrogenase family protein [Desulfoprunum benzoelyticum]|mgnify:CR=1 FL=1|uniref:Glutaryl-CoA dehydrogenase (Non-decarboxylating) n=1 Tax=Desulfoprunum benzoelyticum TaxID=1506996 RepID=A0A840V916_9BACT|nr:acyl-CoA dehydrogenase family protein [Desulfoprunum benzoelyticum]MBB5349431.1 glutaryl-CoA dehydrogenase (non-decarboxylating) [Desulfoprunum benzoelyticum]MBM9531212.1 acyl-CoA dehydrogenase family protein [Desulfoprunum benzoelyticum]
MHFKLTDEQKMMQDMAKDFAEKEILPTLKEDEKNHTFRPELVKKMGDLGFFGCAIPEEYGGNGCGFFESVLLGEQLATVSGSWRVPLNMQNIGPAITVNKFGTKEQKERFIPGWVKGESMGFFGITEPNSGSDVASMGTTATDRGDHWELNGQKMWISNAHVGDWGLLYAFTDRSKKYNGMTCFIINLKNNEGIVTAPIETKLGLHCSPTGEIAFTNAKIPKDSVLGEVGQGFKICMFQLNNTRVSCASGALGIGGGAIKAAIEYANERTQFGKKIGSFQMIQAAIAEMVAEHEAAKLLVYQAAWLKDQGLPNQYQTSMAKLFASEAAVHAALETMKIFGSYGFSTEFPAERFLRDAQSLRVVEGTSNIQKTIIAGMALGDTPNR